MEKLRMTSPDLSKANIDSIAELFPSVMTETLDADGIPVRAIDFDALRQELSDHVVEGPQERYRLDWPGKRAAAFAANAPIAKTLRPERAESVGFDVTRNLFIEGDNLDALKLLQESYLGRVKLIYIDPPYNTGNDFVYNDDFVETTAEYLERSGQIDGDRARLIANPDSSGRFHSDWLSMMYPRLKLARNLLADDGLFVASIDSNEVHNLRRLLDEVFGERNFVADAIVVASPRGRQSDSFLAGVHDGLLIYARNKQFARVGGKPLDDAQRREFNLMDAELGPYRLLGLRQRGTASKRSDRPEMYYPIFVSPGADEVSTVEHSGWHAVLPRKSDGTDGRWAWGKDRTSRMSDILVAKYIARRGEYDIFFKDPLNRVDGERQRKFTTVWSASSFDNQNGTQEAKALLGGNFMSYPKPVALMRAICQLGAPLGGTVIDLFAGSGTTAQAVMSQSLDDGQPRQFIAVQMPESLAAASEAAQAGYGTISEIARERIRRAIDKVRMDAGMVAEGLDLGFRALRVDTTNMADVYMLPDDYEQGALAGLTSSTKNDRTGEDLLFQVLLDWGLPLDMPIRIETLAGQAVHVVDDGVLIACFDEFLDSEVVREIARQEPLRAVFRDSAFASDADRINAEQIFRELSPSTELKAL